MFIPGAFLFAAGDDDREYRSPQMAAWGRFILDAWEQEVSLGVCESLINSGGEDGDRHHAFHSGRRTRLRSLAVASSRPRPDGQACCRYRI